jgi:hypothetical protein
MGVIERFKFLGGSAFDTDWGNDYDVILLPHFLHHFDRDTCVGLLRKVRQALTPTGRALATEFVPNEDRVTPADVADFAFTMLLTTPQGDAYTQTDLSDMARTAGFSGAAFGPIPSLPQTLIEFLR